MSLCCFFLQRLCQMDERCGKAEAEMSSSLRQKPTQTEQCSLFNLMSGQMRSLHIQETKQLVFRPGASKPFTPRATYQKAGVMKGHSLVTTVSSFTPV